MNFLLNSRARDQLASISRDLGMSELDLIHIAIQRLHNEIFANQVPDDGPISEDYLRFLQSKANAVIGNTPLEFDQCLFKE